MIEEYSEETIRKTIKEIKHPAIDRTLWDLGMIKSITINDDKVEILLLFPYPNVPIKEQIIDSIKEPLNKKGLQVNIKEDVMNENELEKFMSIEQKYWKGA